MGGKQSRPGARIKGTSMPFDPEFRFVLALDPAFEEWRTLAAEWWLLKKRSMPTKQGITAFFVTYLHGQGLGTSPKDLLDTNAHVPDLWVSL